MNCLFAISFSPRVNINNEKSSKYGKTASAMFFTILFISIFCTRVQETAARLRKQVWEKGKCTRCRVTKEISRRQCRATAVQGSHFIHFIPKRSEIKIFCIMHKWRFGNEKDYVLLGKIISSWQPSCNSRYISDQAALIFVSLSMRRYSRATNYQHRSMFPFERMQVSVRLSTEWHYDSRMLILQSNWLSWVSQLCITIGQKQVISFSSYPLIPSIAHISTRQSFIFVTLRSPELTDSKVYWGTLV